MRSMTTWLIAVFFTFTLHAKTPDTARIDALAQATVDAWRLPGMAVAVVKDDKVVYLKGYGVRDLKDAGRVTPDTLFHIASTSKAFTTTAMAMLVDEKKMSWDDPVRKHLPWFQLSDPCADSLVTLRDIVSHRTGLKRHDELWDYGAWSREEIIRRIGSVELTKPFRSAYQYHNIMFMTGGETVAAASGMPWSQFVTTRIFQPLAMKNTVIAHDEWLRKEHAASHRYDFATDAIRPYNDFDYESLGPAGSIKSSARDLAQWVRFQLAGGAIDGKRLLSEDALKETWKPHTLLPVNDESRDDNPVTNINAYGLGWRVQDYRGEMLVSHGGALNYHRTQIALLPEQKAGVVVITNINRGYAIIGLRNALLDMLIGKETQDWNAYFLAHDRKLDEEAAKDKREREAKRHRDTKPSRDLSAYAGKYSNRAYGDVTITVEGDHLVMSWQRVKTPLTHYHFDTFSGVIEDLDFDERITFDLGPDGDVQTLEMFGEEFKKE
ncbi:MAG TPA: serine hydrolase [Thermoanaerobaculia bacterium]|nr:serine hydrolase [Thermoanaerobaculia bacterium]